MLSAYRQAPLLDPLKKFPYKAVATWKTLSFCRFSSSSSFDFITNFSLARTSTEVTYSTPKRYIFGENAIRKIEFSFSRHFFYVLL